MELKHFIYFETVCECRSFSKTANQLFVTQQAVSKKIKELEDELDTQLFVRLSTGVELTDEGRFFRQEGAFILEKEKAILNHFSALSRDKKNKLLIGLSHGINIFFHKQFFKKFEENNPDISLKIIEMWNQQIEDDILNGIIDVGFTIEPDNNPNLRVVKLFSEPICCIVNKNHPLASRSRLTIEDILNETIVMADENFKSYYNFIDQCRRHNKTPDVKKVPDLMSIYEACFQENVIGFSFEKFKDLISFHDICYIPLDDVNARWDICLIWNETAKNNRKIKAFLDYVTLENNIPKRS